MTPAEVDAARESVTCELLARGHKLRGATIRFPCPAPTHPDAHPSADWQVEKGAWICQSRGCQTHYGGGSVALAGLLGIDASAAPSYAAVAAATAVKIAARQEAARDSAAALERVTASGYDRDCADRLWRDAALIGRLSAQGLTRDALAVFLVGLDPAAPVRGRWPALVWPWIDAAAPVSYQYRNLDDASPERYRWHGAIGANGARLYRSTATGAPCGKAEPLASGPLVVVEGFKKMAVLWGHGWPNVAACVNVGALDDVTTTRLAGLGDDLIFAPDPDAADTWRERARLIPGARIAVLPAKVDDLIVGVGASAVRQYLDRARVA